jgi:hypothetical protein
MGAKVRVSQRLKSLRGIVVRNCGFSEIDFFVVCDDISIAICPFFVIVTGASKTWYDAIMAHGMRKGERKNCAS